MHRPLKQLLASKVQIIVVLLASASASTGCPQGPADRGPAGRNASQKPPQRAKPGPRLKPGPVTSTTAGPRRPPARKSGTTAPSADTLKRRKTCLSLYRARITHLSALLAKVGVNRTQEQLAKDYGLDSDETLRTCIELSTAQRRCVIAQPNPLIAGQPCRLEGSLGLPAPPALMALLAPKPVAVDEVTAGRQLAGLRGHWVQKSTDGRRTELNIGPGGHATFRQFRGNRPAGEAIASVLSIRHRRELLGRRAVTVQRYVYFRVNRDTFLLSGNPLHTATPIRGRTSFQLILARDRVLRVAAGQCEVIDLGYLAGYSATCTWNPDGVTQIPVLQIAYTLGQWKLRSRFLHIGAHLINERLYRRRFVRRPGAARAN